MMNRVENNQPPTNTSTSDTETAQKACEASELHASKILFAFDQASHELVGKAVVLTDGKAGDVETVSLDELHGLRISIKGHDGKWPISTLKFCAG
jgi:hypothetical protein